MKPEEILLQVFNDGFVMGEMGYGNDQETVALALIELAKAQLAQRPEKQNCDHVFERLKIDLRRCMSCGLKQVSYINQTEPSKWFDLLEARKDSPDREKISLFIERWTELIFQEDKDKCTKDILALFPDIEEAQREEREKMDSSDLGIIIILWILGVSVGGTVIVSVIWGLYRLVTHFS